jgi:hypothetical protein
MKVRRLNTLHCCFVIASNYLLIVIPLMFDVKVLLPSSFNDVPEIYEVFNQESRGMGDCIQKSQHPKTSICFYLLYKSLRRKCADTIFTMET